MHPGAGAAVTVDHTAEDGGQDGAGCRYQDDGQDEGYTARASSQRPLPVGVVEAGEGLAG